MSTNASHKRSRKTKRFWKTATFTLLLLVLALTAALLYPVVSKWFSPADSTIEPAAEPAAEPVVEAPAAINHTLSFSVPDDKSFSVSVVDGESVEMPDGPEIQGYTFLGWLDADGAEETRESLVPTEDMFFFAQYAIAFRNESNATTHMPYMALDANGCFRPNDSISRGDMVNILFRLLDLNGVGTGFFMDVRDDDPIHAAAATLKDLGLIEGDRLHADDTVTYGELFSLLAKLFPAPKGEYDFSALSRDSEYYRAFCLALEKGWLRDTAASAYDLVSRKEFARIANQLIGRRGTAHGDISRVGTILDVALTDAYYSDIAEAIVQHDCTQNEEAETWTGSVPLAFREKGYFFLGSELHYIKDDRSAAISETVDGFAFDGNGALTSGDPALDELVRDKLRELVDPATQSKEDMLKILYDFVLHDSFYLGGSKYAKGETGWETAEAYKMLSTGKGNCYAYAATFWALARAIGYDAVCYSGSVGTYANPHGWVEITISGTPYIFDPTLEYEQWYGPGTHTFEHFYMKSYASVSGWTYDRG